MKRMHSLHSRTGNVLRSFFSYNFCFFAFYRKTFLLQMREANLLASYLLPLISYLSFHTIHILPFPTDTAFLGSIAIF